jgi:hypothetical protein
VLGLIAKHGLPVGHAGPHPAPAALWIAARMREKVPQTQMLFIVKLISASVGIAPFAISAVARMICPDWQKPHCGT